MAMTPEEKEARRAAREAKKLAEEEAKREEFLKERERFRNESPYAALQLLARAEKQLLVHTKVISGYQSRKNRSDDEYMLVQFWTGDDELNLELFVWKNVAETPYELDCSQWEFENTVREFEQYEEKQDAERKRAQKREELLERLSAEERELLGW